MSEIFSVGIMCFLGAVSSKFDAFSSITYKYNLIQPIYVYTLRKLWIKAIYLSNKISSLRVKQAYIHPSSCPINL